MLWSFDALNVNDTTFPRRALTQISYLGEGFVWASCFPACFAVTRDLVCGEGTMLWDIQSFVVNYQSKTALCETVEFGMVSLVRGSTMIYDTISFGNAILIISEMQYNVEYHSILMVVWKLELELSSRIRWCLAWQQWYSVWRPYVCVCMCSLWWSGPCTCDGSLTANVVVGNIFVYVYQLLCVVTMQSSYLWIRFLGPILQT